MLSDQLKHQRICSAFGQLSTGMRRFVFLHCYRRQKVDLLHYRRIETIDDAVASNKFSKTEKSWALSVLWWRIDGFHFLWRKEQRFSRFPATWVNNWSLSLLQMLTRQKRVIYNWRRGNLSSGIILLHNTRPNTATPIKKKIQKFSLENSTILIVPT